MEVKNNNNEIEKLQQELQKFKQNSDNKGKSVLKAPKNKNIATVYSIFCDILGGIITAFILNQLYEKLFGKNKLVFALLLIFCIAGAFYNSVRIFLKNNNYNNNANKQ